VQITVQCNKEFVDNFARNLKDVENHVEGSFIPKTAGSYLIRVTDFDNKQLKGSPLTMEVLESGKILNFTNETDKGCLNFIGQSLDDTKPWVNPVDAGLLQITASAALGSPFGTCNVLVDQQKKPGSQALEFSTSDAPNSWIQITLKKPVQLTSYSLQCGSQKAFFPKSWSFQGSKDGSTWVNLHNSKDFIFNGPYTTNNFPVTTTQLFSIFKLTQVAANQGGTTQFVLAEVELYGVMNTA